MSLSWHIHDWLAHLNGSLIWVNVRQFLPMLNFMLRRQRKKKQQISWFILKICVQPHFVRENFTVLSKLRIYFQHALFNRLPHSCQAIASTNRIWPDLAFGFANGFANNLGVRLDFSLRRTQCNQPAINIILVSYLVINNVTCFV